MLALVNRRQDWLYQCGMAGQRLSPSIGGSRCTTETGLMDGDVITQVFLRLTSGK